MSELDERVEGVGLDVGFICQGWYPDVGGVESHTRDLARELMSRGHRVHALCLDYRDGREPYTIDPQEVEGVQVRRVAYRYHDHGALADVYRNAKLDDVVLAWLAETPCDIVHVHHATGFGTGALETIRDVGCPLVMTLHDYWSLDPRGQLLHIDGAVSREADPERTARSLAACWPHLMPSGSGRSVGPRGEALEGDTQAMRAALEFNLACLGRANRLIAPSRAAALVYERSGLKAPIEVCENGIDVLALAAEARRLRAERAPRDELWLGVLGSAIPSKGPLELAQAFAEADIAGLELHVHGNLVPYHGDTRYVDELRAAGENHPRIHVHGEYGLDQLPNILAGLDGVAAPSRWEEVYGLTVREARAAGLPVLVSDAGDLPAVTAGGEAGLVVPRDDRAAWIDALRRFATDDGARDAWSRATAPVRTAREMMLQLERCYLEVILDETGVMPELAHAVEGLVAPARAKRQDAPQRKPGLLGRLFGRS